MKKKQKLNIDVKGLSINDIMNKDWNDLAKLNLSDLKALTQRLVSASNKRLKRLEQSNIGDYSTALQNKKKSGARFSTKSKNINELRKEFRRAKSFLKSKTSTIKGTKKVINRMNKKISGSGLNEVGGFKSKRTYKRFWNIYHELEQTQSGLIGIVGGSTEVQKLVYDSMKHNRSNKGALEDINQRLDELYEDLYNDDYEDEDISDVFNIDDLF